MFPAEICYNISQILSALSPEEADSKEFTTSHTLTINPLGPVQCCRMQIDQFTILTGPQSNGKSTIAKAIYFFRSVKQDILQIMLQGGPRNATGLPGATWEKTLKQRMREKFLQLFGTSWIMPADMTMTYTYSDWVSIHVSLCDGLGEANYVDFTFSETLSEYLQELEHQVFVDMTAPEREHHAKTLNKLFVDIYEPVFIPAGRNLITLLSTQLNYIFTSLEGSQLRSIDYVTKRYTELILKLKPLFQHGMTGLWEEYRRNPENAPSIRRISPAINLLLEMANSVLQGAYRYMDGEERLYLDEKRYVKINLSSSGQQEVVWIFNLLFYYLLEERRVFLILEEPESHLYPEAQRVVSEVLSLFSGCGNALLVTTHSPYVLGTFNYLLLATQAPEDRQQEVKKAIHKRKWLNPKTTAAYFISGGCMKNILTSEDGLSLIQNSAIDGASQSINQLTDAILDQSPAGGDVHDYA